ncbi:hypothetical protein [Nocardia sp. NPDC046763]|uniref:hypothetical protein n=1 Tax=Nocardia sp. NPDC046763 TaxID=3155256 RepID=UPI0033F783CB
MSGHSCARRRSSTPLIRPGRNDAAAPEYRAALDLTANDAERAYLRRRLGEVEG